MLYIFIYSLVSKVWTSSRFPVTTSKHMYYRSYALVRPAWIYVAKAPSCRDLALNSGAKNLSCALWVPDLVCQMRGQADTQTGTIPTLRECCCGPKYLDTLPCSV